MVQNIIFIFIKKKKYFVRKFIVRYNNMSYKLINHRFMLNFMSNTNVIDVVDENFSRQCFYV